MHPTGFFCFVMLMRIPKDSTSGYKKQIMSLVSQR